MLKGEYFSKYVRNVELAEDKNAEILDVKEKVKVLVDGCIERVRIADACMIYGFNKEYSVENIYPSLAENWSEINKYNPSEVFYKADIVVFIKTSDGDVPFNLLDTPEEILNDAEQIQRENYNFRTLAEFERLVKDSGTTTFITELISRYTKLVSHFLKINESDIANIQDNITLSFSLGELKEFFKSYKLDSYSRSSYIISTYNFTFNILELDIRVGVDYFDISGDTTEYVKKNELLRYCDMFNNPQLAYILYGTFMGFGENQFEILRSLKMSNINKNKKVVNWNGIEYPIDDSFISIAEECNSITSYTEISMRGDTTPKEQPLNPASEYILKPRMQSNNNYGLERMAGISVRTAIARASEYLFGNRTLNKTYLHRSGILNRMYELEQKNGNTWTTYNINQKDSGLMFRFNVRDMINSYKINYLHE